MTSSIKIIAFFLLIYVSLFPAQIKTDSLFSKSLNENVKLSIYLPKNYSKDAQKKFPVIYLLDSEINMSYFAPMTEFQARSYRDKGQTYIIVGIEPDNRTKSYTPTKSSMPDPKNNGKSLFTDSGGGALFTEFLQNELKEKINTNYRTEDFSVLVGHSFGGLLAVDILLKHPDYFNAFIINDPSFWWDNSYILGLIKKNEVKKSEKKPFVFVSRAEEKNHDHGFEKGQPEGLPIFENYLKHNSFPYKTISYPDETHGSVSYKANFDGLRAVFKYRTEN